MFKKNKNILLVILFILVNVCASYITTSADITADKRYTLHPQSIATLQNLQQPVTINVLLKGNYPASFKRLVTEITNFLQTCNTYAKGKLTVTYTNPIQDLGEEAAQLYKDSLGYFYDIQSIALQTDEQGANAVLTQQNILPGALVTSGSKTFGVNLLRSAILNTTNAEATAQQYEKIAATLENKFIDAIIKATNDNVQTVAYAVGNGQPSDSSLTINDAITTIAPKTENSNTYKFGVVNLQQAPFVPSNINTLIVLKPTKPFTDADKLKLDQYLMRGGNIFFMIDNMYAEFDSLIRSGQQGFIAFDRGLNIDDLLFSYGVRINQNILQDLEADELPLVSGNNQSGMQTQQVKFSFLPILQGTNSNISSNLNGVRAFFPNTIDTILGKPNIQKTILLTSSNHAKLIGTPYKVDFSFMNYANDITQFTIKDTAVAVLLQGKFESYFANRLPINLADTLKKYEQTFLAEANLPGKIIVIADGDIATNLVTPKGEPLQMGENNYTGITYANKDFYNNCLAYLTGNEATLASRSKYYTPRLLDAVKVAANTTKWQVIVVAVPLVLLLVFVFIFSASQKKKYTKTS